MKKSRKAKRIFQTVCAIFLIILYWLWLFCVTPQAENANTVKIQETVSEVKIISRSHRGTDQLLLFCKEECYLLDMGARNEDRTLDLANKIKNKGNSVTLTVWKHIPKNLFDVLNTSSFFVKQAVDVRDGSVVYWSMEDHNAYQSRERGFGVVGGVFVTFILLVFVCFRNMADIEKTLQKYIKKRKQNSSAKHNRF